MSAFDQTCPACGYELGFEPWDGPLPSEKVCACCGIQFGYDDAEPERRESAYLEWRKDWVAEGMAWWSSTAAPEGWNPVEQLARVAGRATS